MSTKHTPGKLFHFSQNNSGGYFVRNNEHGVCEEMIIEATSAADAKERLYRIGSKVYGFDDSCPCCGDRWPTWIDESDGKEAPEIYGEPIERVKKELFRDRAFIHYMDGTFKEVVFPDKKASE